MATQDRKRNLPYWECQTALRPLHHVGTVTRNGRRVVASAARIELPSGSNEDDERYRACPRLISAIATVE